MGVCGLAIEEGWPSRASAWWMRRRCGGIQGDGDGGGWWRCNGATAVRAAQTPPYVRPLAFPASATDNAPQCQQLVGVRPFPMHASAFETCLHDQLVGALYDPAADRQALCEEGRVVDEGCAFFEVLAHASNVLPSFLGEPLKVQPGKRAQHLAGRRPERRELGLEPVVAGERSGPKERLRGRPEVLGAVGAPGSRRGPPQAIASAPPALGQRGRCSPCRPPLRPAAASASRAPTPVPHPGGKSATPHAGQDW